MMLLVLVTMFFQMNVEKQFYLFSGGDGIEDAENCVARSAKEIAEAFGAIDYLLYVPRDARFISKEVTTNE